MEQKAIKIYLSSSNELSDDREKFGNFVRRINKIYSKRGLHIDLFDWEDSYAFTGRRTQDEYNEKVRESDMFVAMFYTRAGKFTIEEFDVAMDEYRKKGSPKVFVYCRILQEGEEDTPELKAFKERLSEDGYFWTNYSNLDQMQLYFIQQLLMMENSLEQPKLEEGRVTLDGLYVAELANLPFAAGNKDYQRMSAELSTIPKDIENVRQYVNEHPDNGYMRDELQKKLNRYDALKVEFAGLQKNLFETSQRIAGMQHEQLSDNLRLAIEAFKIGNVDGANALLDEIELEAETHYAEIDQNLELVHQDIEAFMLRAKTVMAEVNTPIKERIKQVQDIYAKADKWAKDSALPDETYERLLKDYSRFLYDYGLYKEAEPIYLRLIALCEKMYGKEHIDTATSYNNIGGLYDDQGDYAKALEYYWKSLDILERVLGPDHPSTATSYNNIGLVYDDLGDYAKALEYYEKALDIRERLLDPDLPPTATSYNNIGTVYYNQGDYAKALDYYKKALDIWERVLGPEHPHTMAAKESIEICREEMQG